jgi:acyl carrier protein
MDNDDIIQTLRATLTEQLVLTMSPDQITDDTPLMDGGLNLDSMGIVEVIGLVESTFDMQFDETDFRVDTFENLRTLADVISRRVKS